MVRGTSRCYPCSRRRYLDTVQHARVSLSSPSGTECGCQHEAEFVGASACCLQEDRAGFTVSRSFQIETQIDILIVILLFLFLFELLEQ
jgi:hypothetical protein